VSYSPLSLSRKHVLGDLYVRCDEIIDDIPVYLEGEEPQVLGHVNQSLGHYADAFSFFVEDIICKKLAAGHYQYSFDYESIDGRRSDSRIKLNSITLIGRSGYAKPILRRRA
jgi:hypothetical protein